MVESGVDACSSNTTASGKDCVDRLSKVLKCSCTLQQQMPCRTVVSHPAPSTGQMKLHISGSAAE